MPATKGTAADARDCLRALAARQSLPLILLIGFAWLVAERAADIDIAAVLGDIGDIDPGTWAASGLAAAISFWAVGRMEWVVHRLAGTGAAPHAAQVAGITSIATAQMAGFGLLTGTLARWRMLPSISVWQAVRITVLVSGSFMAALIVLCAVMAALAGPDIPYGRPAAFAILGLAAMVVVVSLWPPFRLRHMKLPPVRAIGILLALAALDTAAAGLALYVFLPAPVTPDPAVFYAVYLLALCAGLAGATPGGIGPFEFVLLACLPQVGEAPMLAAIMAYRVVYFVLPALVAGGVLVAGPRLFNIARQGAEPHLRAVAPSPRHAVGATALSFTATRAEAGLMRQGEFQLLCDGQQRPVSIVACAGQSLIMLGDPLRPDADAGDALAALESVASTRLLAPCLYKCGPRLAVAARRAGWAVQPIAREACLDPANFDLQAPARRQLRRQLRKAERAGVTVAEAGHTPPFAEMRRIAEGWAKARGRARGFSMGRFDPAYVAGQRVYLAYHGEALVAFLTLHDNWQERSLDLICHDDDAPPGTMHLLVVGAIEAAAQEGCHRFSLAAVPVGLPDTLRMPAWLRARFEHAVGAAGLMRFKSSFAPEWRPLYIAAPSRIGMVAAALDLVDRITRPREIMHRTA
ncbi:MAG: phosphatidylglycerol lysyltransferase domain-containing protein [Rhodobacter sp.]|nr:phosphatidylglycerol lysyltransferase domain-containing protein [Rhodobacter sp.]